MYMVLVWRTAVGQSEAAVSAEIRNAVGAREFTNRMEVFGHHLIANVHRNYNNGDALVLLANELNARATGRFSFVMYLVPKGNIAWFSSDLSSREAEFDNVADY